MKVKNSWNVKPTNLSKNSINVIRNIVDTMKLEPNPEKSLIPLSIGDPSTFGNLKPCKEIIDALEKSLKSFKYNGYLPATGTTEAKQAVVDFCKSYGEKIAVEDVFLTSGCSSALDLSISLLAEPGKNILVPRPGFPLYQTLAIGLGIKIKFYDLIPEKDFSIDLEHFEKQIDENTVAIVYNNPSNPCGSLFSEQHILDFLKIAEKYRLPVIADEIYEYMVFPGNKFYPIGNLSENVPILSCRGTTKRFLIPGYRLGWILFQDRHDIFGKEMRVCLTNLCTRILGSNSLIQGALPDILSKTPESFFNDTINVICTNAELAYNRLKNIPGLLPIKPQAAMYLMVSIELHNFPEFKNDLKFIEKLTNEQSVVCLPGKCFDIENYVRIVLTVPKQILEEALNRIEIFCSKHYVNRKKILKIERNSLYDVDKNGDKSSNNEAKHLKLLKNQTRKLSEQKDLINSMVSVIEMDI